MMQKRDDRRDREDRFGDRGYGGGGFRDRGDRAASATVRPWPWCAMPHSAGRVEP